MKLESAVEEFLADLHINGRAPLTLKRHKQELVLLDRWLDEQGLDWLALVRKELQRYLRTRADLSASARGNMNCTFRTFFAWAVEEEYIALSPAASLKTPRRPQTLPRALTLDQVRLLVSHLRACEGRKARRDEAMLLTGLYAGLRPCELAMLHWPVVDLPGGVINIRLSKMNKGRGVPIHPALGGLLARWRTIQDLDDEAPVFSLDKLPITSGRVGKVARHYARKLHLPLTAHVLRHTFATWSLRRSGNLYAVSKALGHSQVAQTEIYVSADVEDLRSTVEQLPGLESW